MAQRTTHPSRPMSALCPFHWREHMHGSFLLDDRDARTPLYTEWRNKLAAGQTEQPWEQYRDAALARAHAPRGSASPRRPGGFGVHNGTMHGLSDKADARLAKQQQPAPQRVKAGLMPIVASAWIGSKVQQAHGGAFSKAGTKGGSSKIHKPASKKAGKVAAS